MLPPPVVEAAPDDEGTQARAPLSQADLIAIGAAQEAGESEARAAREHAAEEAVGYLDGMREGARACEIVFGELLAMSPCPAGSPTEGRHDWDGECADGWNRLAWSPSQLEVDTGTRPATLCQFEIGVKDGGDDIQAVSRCDGDKEGRLEPFIATIDGPGAPADPVRRPSAGRRSANGPSPGTARLGRTHAGAGAEPQRRGPRAGSVGARPVSGGARGMARNAE